MNRFSIYLLFMIFFLINGIANGDTCSETSGIFAQSAAEVKLGNSRVSLLNTNRGVYILMNLVFDGRFLFGEVEYQKNIVSNYENRIKSIDDLSSIFSIPTAESGSFFGLQNNELIKFRLQSTDDGYTIISEAGASIPNAIQTLFANRNVRTLVPVVIDNKYYLIQYVKSSALERPENITFIKLQQNTTKIDCEFKTATSIGDSPYVIEFIESIAVIRDMRISSISCYHNISRQASISELIGCRSDPCRGSQLDDIIPFQESKLVFFGYSYYLTKSGIRQRNRVMESFSLKADAFGFPQNPRPPLTGAVVDAAYFDSLTKKTFVFIGKEVYELSEGLFSAKHNISTYFNLIDFGENEMVTAAFKNPLSNAVILFSKNKYRIATPGQTGFTSTPARSTEKLFSIEKRVDATDFDINLFIFFERDHHFTFEKLSLTPENSFGQKPSLDRNNSETIFYCVQPREVFKSVWIKLILVLLLLLVVIAIIITIFALSSASYYLSSKQRSKSQSKSGASAISTTGS
ncbi:hypothetical protein B4U79_18390 [Dinothrombium tinctorium]|uniref:Uncharacterized protein n=1 Tax=Dinothrombium tinctorium TaxID=1965070 RepID=A0A3S3NJJ3_9ACAR|nr:hypothetical protein B4U79_18390 [Dinothrombium tinctorium]